MELIKNYPVRSTLGTIVVAVLFVVSVTRTLTQDRDAVFAELAKNKAAHIQIIDEHKELRREVCDLEEKLRKVNSELKQEDRKLWEENHAAQIALTEIKTKLVGVEALLVKIDKKLP